jgi:sodium/proline symporter
MSYELIAILVYFSILFTIAYFSYRRVHTASDFMLGSRSMNYWLTALATHASDMSSWLFLAYPASLLHKGLLAAWAAIGLIVCMFLNWQFIAPKIRVATEQFNSLTFSSFFESRFGDTSGRIRVFSALILIVFYTIYIAAALISLGSLLELLFDVNYTWGILLGILIVVPYVFMGGYLTLAWIDLFQGLFLLGVIIAVPWMLLSKVGGWDGVTASMRAQHLASSLFPDFSRTTVLSIVSMALGWGLGYFGQPHIVTKFMGIKNVSDIAKSKWIGMSWMVLSLGAATVIGAVGIPFFQGKLANTEFAFVKMVQLSFHPLTIGFIFCAILAATINNMGSQVLVLSSSITEDFYKRLFRKEASSKELLLVSRLGIVFVAIAAFWIAQPRTSTIYDLVHYAWSGIGASFGPLVILALYSQKVNKYGAWAGLITGAVVTGVWPSFNTTFSPMLPGFAAGIAAIFLVSKLKQPLLWPQ